MVVDGGSSDQTLTIVRRFQDVELHQTKITSRAHQMNVGSRLAKAALLYFVHADVGLVPTFVEDIQKAVGDGFPSGCFSCQFVAPAHPLLKINAWFTKFPFRWCRGGDQTLFIRRDQFFDLGGFNEGYVIMEDYELLDKLLDGKSFKVINKNIKISARKYRKNSYLKVQYANLRAMRMFRRGMPSQVIKDFYLQALKH